MYDQGVQTSTTLEDDMKKPRGRMIRGRWVPYRASKEALKASAEAQAPRKIDQGERDLHRQMLEQNGCDPDDADTWEGL